MLSHLKSIRLTLTMACLTALFNAGHTLVVLAQEPARDRAILQAAVKPERTNSDRRVALVIGNGAYTDVPALSNPPNDAADLAEALRSLGFSEVILATNADLRSMEAALSQFHSELLEGGVGVFFYAGHGVQAQGENYLIPVDAEIEVEDDLRYETLPLGKVLGRMQSAENPMNIVILDACRDNPFATNRATNSGGLAQLETDDSQGLFIAYATAPGNVAADGDGRSRNSPFTASLLENIESPGLDVELMFKQVRRSVLEKTSNRQRPWTSSSLVDDFYFNEAQISPTLVASNPSATGLGSVSRPAVANPSSATDRSTPITTPSNPPVSSPPQTPPENTTQIPDNPPDRPPTTLNPSTPETPTNVAAATSTSHQPQDERIQVSSSSRRGDRYTFEGQAGQEVQLSLTSDDFDTYLILQNDRGEGITENDDGGDSTNSDIVAILPDTGTYQVVVASYDEEAVGAYTLTINGSRREQGRLEASDSLIETRYVKVGDSYSVAGRSGQTWQISLESVDFDPYLILQNSSGETIAENDDTLDSRNSLLNFTVPNDDNYRIVATSFGDQGSGSYQLRVQEVQDVNPPIIQQATAQLNPNDSVVARSYDRQGNAYPIQGQAGQRLQVNLTSQDLDTYLILQNQAGEVVAEDDDGGDGTNSFLDTVLPTTGTYQVVATSYGEGNTGTYQLSAKEFRQVANPLLAPVTGNLGEGSENVPIRYTKAGDRYTIEGQAGQSVEIAMESSDFDTYVILQDEQGQQIAFNDDGSDSTNSSLNTVLPSSGNYRVIATGYGDDSVGAYSLRVSEWQRTGSPLVQTTGRLEPTDELLSELDKRGDRHTFRGQAGQQVMISLTSSDFDTYMVVQDEQGQVIGTDDDSGEGYNALLNIALPRSGTYSVLATSYSSDSTGAYDLNVQPVQRLGNLLTNGRIEPGETVVADTQFRRGNTYTFQGQAGQQVEVALNSSDFDTYVILQNDRGEIVAENDDGSDGTNSLLNAVLPSSGTYTVVAASYGNEGVGNYSLAINQVTNNDRSLLDSQTGQITPNTGQVTSRYSRQGNAYTFQGRAGQEVSIRMTSGDFDTYIILQNDRGEILAENDDGGDGSNSYLIYTLPENGTYRVLASTFNDGVQGSYQLEVKERRGLNPPLLEQPNGTIGSSTTR